MVSENIRLSVEVLVWKSEMNKIKQHYLDKTEDLLSSIITWPQNENYFLLIVEDIGKNTNTE